MATPVEILSYLAGLAGGQTTRGGEIFNATGTKRAVWLGDHPLDDGSEENPPPPEWWARDQSSRLGATIDFLTRSSEAEHYTTPSPLRGPEFDAVARADALSPLTSNLRMGSHWLIGWQRIDHGKPIRIEFPVLSRRVRLHATVESDRFQPQWLSDIEVEPFFEDLLTAGDLDRILDPETGTRFLAKLCSEAGWAVPRQVRVGENPRVFHPASLARATTDDHEGLVLGAGTALFIEARDAPGLIARGLERWVGVGLDDTAFARLYDGSAITETDEQPSHVQSPFPTNERQRLAIAQARDAEVSVVSGPPGTGKTHVVAAAAVDTIARGGSVLIAAKSDHAAESVCEVLDRNPSPPYVRFGRAEHRHRIGQQIANDQHAQPNDDERDAAEAAEAEARQRHADLTSVITGALERELVLEDGLQNRSTAEIVTAEAPGVRDEQTDLDQAQALLDQSRHTTGFLARWRAQRAERRLRRLVDARPGATVDQIERAVRAARVERDVSHVLGAGGMSLAELWTDLAAADSHWRETLARLIDVRRRHSGGRSQRRSRTSAAALATVLRTGTERRTDMLGDLDSDDFLDLLPLWVGTLNEVERTLPVVPSMFDLVILDEASQIDQVIAAGALCRARRVMIVGDPRQLRHVSFVADADMDDEYAEIEDPDPALRRVLDIRRNSLYDVGAAAAPVTWLDEHFRSVPHLIEFSSSRFYDGALRLMTQHPRNENIDAIEQRRIADGGRYNGVNIREVEHVRDMVAAMISRPDCGTIGILSPFRKQADALTNEMLEHFSLEQIEAAGLRVGTVHGFQGIERDTMIVSLALGSDDLGRSLRFVEDPNLFNVMVTRARHQIILLHSFDPTELPVGTLRDYFRAVDDPPGAASGDRPASIWTREVADALADGGHRVITQYPVAGWEIDIALGTGDAAIGVECGVHPDGTTAHIERHLALRRAGWDLVDAFQSRWILDPGELAVNLTVELSAREAAQNVDAG